MYTLALRKKFIAHHKNTAESLLRSHLYLLEVMLEAEALDSLGMVVDLDALDDAMDDVLALYQDKNLNEAEAFADTLPTLEALAKVLATAIDETLYAPNLTALSVRLWRDEEAWALYDIEK
jgi:6-pyruvoyltetrahydropterin/6-carboxytetrahydropterin synthase